MSILKYMRSLGYEYVEYVSNKGNVLVCMLTLTLCNGPSVRA